jgi:hypothetical protein
MAAAIYRQQKILSHFPVCCWIDWLLMIKNCLIESGPPCSTRSIILQNRYKLLPSKNVSEYATFQRYTIYTICYKPEGQGSRPYEAYVLFSFFPPQFT